MSLSQNKSAGFTLIELVMVIIIVSILAATVIPKYWDSNIFKQRGFIDQVFSTLRYAQKIAIAQHRFLCVSFTSSSVSLTIDTTPVTASYSSSTCSGAAMANLADTSHNITAPSGVAFSTTPSSFYFDDLGKPSTGTFGVIGTTTITVENETGYVY